MQQLGNVEQTFGGEPLYPSVQARAASLLYFLIKDHPFSARTCPDRAV